MDSNKTAPHEFIQLTFAPLIAVAASPGAEEVCQKNNLDFTTLLKPFSKSTVETQIKDPSAIPIPVKPRVSFCDINSRPPPLNIARSYFNEAISSHVYERTVPFQCGTTTIDIPSSTPWFDAWRNTYLQVQYPSEHEFTKHYIGCLILTASLDSSPVEQVARLTQDVTDMINQTNNGLPKWFGPLPNILLTYLFLHDNSTQSSVSKAAFEAMKTTYGSQKCFYLAINSQDPDKPSVYWPDPWLEYLDSMVDYKEIQGKSEPPVSVESALEAAETANANSPDIAHPLSPEEPTNVLPTEGFRSSRVKSTSHGALLSSEDLGRITEFVNEFCTKALVPHFEQLIGLFTDQISVKKGVSRSLLIATKRWFGTNKPGIPGQQISPTAIAYSGDSHELQLRKLGDLCFMIGLYNTAYNAYHSAKRDFLTDGAWLHYAGALEMAALAAFMTDDQQFVKKMIEYAEESISTYQTSSRYNPFATRATLLSTECLKGKGLYCEAAKQFIRMSGEDSDLRSAVLLEQAAYCFLHSSRPSMFRKYAFHMVLAGNRYSKASHKNHSMRCYYQAYQVYESKNWTIAEDHILHTIGKHAFNLKLTYNEFEALSALIKRSSRQAPQQQRLYLKDYIKSVQNMMADGDEGVLSIPVADGKFIQVILNVSSNECAVLGRVPASDISYNKSSAGTYLDEVMWAKLEERLVNFCGMSNTLVFTPTVGILNDRSKNTKPVVIVKGEHVGVRILIRNPLNIPVSISNVTLKWRHDSFSSNHDGSPAAISSILQDVFLQPESSSSIMIMLTPMCVGSLQVTSLKYVLHESGSSVEGIQHLIPEPHAKHSSNNHEADCRLAFTVVGEAPHLHVSFSGLASEFSIGELSAFTIHLHNDGASTISQVLVTCSDNFDLLIDGMKNCSGGSKVYDLNVSLLPNESKDVHAKIHPSWLEGEGMKVLKLLFYYRNGKAAGWPRYRLVRHSWPIEIMKAFKMDVSMTKLMSSSSDNELLNIAVWIRSNPSYQGQCENVTIDSIAMYSQHWRSSSLVHGDTEPTIKKGEDLFILVRAEQLPQPTVTLSQLQFTDLRVEAENMCFVPQHTGSLDLGKEILMIVSWKSLRLNQDEVETSCGQDYCIVHLDVKEPVLAEFLLNEDLQPALSPIIDKLIDYQLLHETCIENNDPGPWKNRSLIVNATLRLINRSNVPQVVQVVTNYSTSQSKSKQLSSWNWLGKGLHECHLVPFEEDLLNLEAVFYKRGIYNLMSGVDIMLKIGNEYIVQNDPSNSSVIIVR